MSSVHFAHCGVRKVIFWLSAVLFVTTLCLVMGFFFGGAATARAEGESVVLTAGWVYDGTAHDLFTVASGYEGQMTVTVYDSEFAPIEAQQVVEAGTYYVTVDAEAYGDFEALYIDQAEVVVSPRAITVQLLSGGTSAYGDKLSPIAGVVFGNLVEGDSWPWHLMYTHGGVQIESMVDAGEYVVKAVGNDDANYAITFVDGLGQPSNTTTYTITPRPIEVTILPATSQYGDDAAPLRSQVTGLLSNDAEPFSLHCDVDPTYPVGDYPITLTESGNPNYTITSFSEGTYTVTRRLVKVAAVNVGHTYGDAPATLSAEVVEGSFLDGTPYSLSCPDVGQLTSRTHVGTYRISVTSSADDNYSVTTVDGTYTVSPRYIEIVIHPSSSVYGEDVASLSADHSAVLEGDDNVYMLGVNVDSTTPIGAYDIFGTTLSTDYTVRYIGGERAYTVTPRPLTITWEDTRFTYDGQPHLPTVAWGNTANGDVFIPTIEGAATDVGVYTASAISVNNDNYVMPPIASVGFVIEAAPAVLVMTDVTTVFAYTGEIFSLQGVVTSGETTFVGNSFREVGEYTVTVNSAATANYLAGSWQIAVTVTEALPVRDEASGVMRYHKVIAPEIAASKGGDLTALLQSVVDDDVGVTLVAEVGYVTVTFDQAAVEAMVADILEGDSVLLRLSLSDPTNDLPPDTQMVIDVSLTGNTFGKGTATVSLPYSYKEQSGRVAKIYCVQEDGTMTDMHADFDGDKVTFATAHFSRFILLYEDKLSTGTIVGITIGCVFGGLLLFFSVYWFLILHKRFADIPEIFKRLRKK
jgi:hypothetical protein